MGSPCISYLNEGVLLEAGQARPVSPSCGEVPTSNALIKYET